MCSYGHRNKASLVNQRGSLTEQCRGTSEENLFLDIDKSLILITICSSEAAELRHPFDCGHTKNKLNYCKRIL